MIDHHRDILRIERGTYRMCKVAGVKVAQRTSENKNQKFEI
jgi:hypothetical protein